MNDILATALAHKLETLPFVPFSYGLVRLAEEPKPVEGGDTRLIRYPIPLVLPTACSGPPQLLPNPKAGAAFWFEDEGTQPGGTADYREFTSTLRLVGWLDSSRLSEPVAYTTLVGALVGALEGRLQVPGLANTRVKATTIAAGDGSTILSRYTLTDDTRALLRAPYVFFGITLTVKGSMPSVACATLPTLDAAPVCR